MATFTRPDLAFEVNQCSRFMSNPGPSHMAAARRILRYLAGTAHLRLTYEAQPKSTILWASNRQAIVELSSSEAEFYAASAAGCN
eukprot:758188-Rhodomonas_salina.1